MMDIAIQPAAHGSGQPGKSIDEASSQDRGFSQAMRTAAGDAEPTGATRRSDDAQASAPATSHQQGEAPSQTAEPGAGATRQGKMPAPQHPTDDGDLTQRAATGPIRLPGVRDADGRAPGGARPDDGDERPGAHAGVAPKHADDLPAGISPAVAALLRNGAFVPATQGTAATGTTGGAKHRISDAIPGDARLTTGDATDAHKAGKARNTGIIATGIQPSTKPSRQVAGTSPADIAASAAHANTKPPPGKATGPQASAVIDAARTGLITGAQHGDTASVPVASAAALFSPGSIVSATTPAGVAAASPVAATLPAPVASAAWQQQLGQQLVQMVQRGTDRIDLHLNPKELGPLQVSLQLHDQTAQVHFLVAHANVHDAVQQAIPQLREAFANQGISLGGAQVGQQQQQSTGAFGSNPGAPGWTDHGDAAESVQPVRHTTTIASIAATAGGVDLYA